MTNPKSNLPKLITQITGAFAIIAIVGSMIFGAVYSVLSGGNFLIGIIDGVLFGMFLGIVGVMLAGIYLFSFGGAE